MKYSLIGQNVDIEHMLAGLLLSLILDQTVLHWFKLDEISQTLFSTVCVTENLFKIWIVNIQNLLTFLQEVKIILKDDNVS